MSFDVVPSTMLDPDSFVRFEEKRIVKSQQQRDEKL